MSDRRRAQWLRFYEAALIGTASKNWLWKNDPSELATAPTESAERIADASMARLDARDFPPSKVEALIEAAHIVWKGADHRRGNGEGGFVPNHALASLGKALDALKEEP